MNYALGYQLAATSFQHLRSDALMQGVQDGRRGASRS
jgi:hypothetical protein